MKMHYIYIITLLLSICMKNCKTFFVTILLAMWQLYFQEFSNLTTSAKRMFFFLFFLCASTSDCSLHTIEKIDVFLLLFGIYISTSDCLISDTVEKMDDSIWNTKEAKRLRNKMDVPNCLFFETACIIHSLFPLKRIVLESLSFNIKETNMKFYKNVIV